MKNKICNVSVFSAILACVAGVSGDAVCATNTWMDARAQRAYAGAYKQLTDAREQQTYIETQDVPVVQTASATKDLPLAVDDEKLENDIKNNKSDVTVSDLDRCSMIYPTGVFKWGIPESGSKATVKPQCIAVVNLVDSSNKILATTTLAAGDVMDCNINMFPESGYAVDLNDVQLPADAEPTMKDVEKVLNEEQKDNAAFKIAAAMIIGGLAGNMLGPKENGDEKLLGAGKKQLATTAVGAVTAGGLMAASSYSGKVAGDTIKSTAVNATAGMLAGNMAAALTSSNSVLATTKCKVEGKEKDCVIGNYYTKSDKNYTSGDRIFVNKTGGTLYQCKQDNCTSFGKTLLDIRLDFNNNKTKKIADVTSSDWTNLTAYYKHTDEKGIDSFVQGRKQNENSEAFYLVASATEAAEGGSKPAFAVFDKDLPVKPFGYKVSQWEDMNANKKPVFYERNIGDNDAGGKIGDQTKVKFVPSARNAQDGSIIDLTNEARAKSTIIGAAAGGALGGFSGYQGAQAEILDRYATAQREYTDSLSNFGCFTGTRFLGSYNHLIAIPDVSSVKLPEDRDEQTEN